PWSAIERIEVLRDGAAAQYGSDAIGGVVNVVLRRDTEPSLRASAGSAYTSEGGRNFTDGGWVNVGGSSGMAFDHGGYLTFAAELGDRGGTNRAYADRRPQYFPGDPRNDLPPRVSSYLGNGSVREFKGLVSTSMPLGSGVDFHGTLNASMRDALSPDAFFRMPLDGRTVRSEEHTSELQSRENLVCRLLLEKKK